MLFNSVEFVVFLVVVFIVHWFFLKEKPLAQKLWLLAVSCFFYMYLIPVYILILFLTIVVDYGAGIMIERSTGRKRKVYLIVSIVSTCLILAVFKYFDFFIQNINDVASLFGWNYSIKLLGLILPIGLSFHTFQSLAYVIDVYRNQQKAEYNFINYSLYVMYFPQLVAGPIERATHILPQIQKPRSFNYDQAYLGMRIILWGLFKKVVVADSLAEYANYAFAHHQTEGTGTLVLGVVYFAFQIYCDFSGYSDIAVGTSRLFGIELMRNFNVPYFSKSIAEFWRKWHISLSYWFRDYVYIPLGGSVENPFWRFRNLLVVFLLSGFWHGANWTYVVWGLVHVLFYIPSVFFGKSDRKKGYLDMIGTFLIVCLAWIFFRASSIDEAFGYIRHLVVNVDNWDSFLWFSRGLILLIPFVIIEWINKDNSTGIPFIQYNWSKPVQVTYEMILAVLIIISFYTLDHEQFIYFQF